MIKPDTRTLEALARLRANTDFAVVLQWIAASRQDNLVTLEAADKKRGRLQGYGLALSDLLQHAAYAADALSKTGRA